MELIWVLVIIGAIINSVNKAKKKQQAEAYKKTHPTAGQQAAGARRAKPAAQRPAPAVQQPKAVPRQEAFHHAVPFEAHSHDTSSLMGQEGVGDEGTDCCHDFMLNSPEENAAPEVQAYVSEEDQARAKMLLQGVVMSEILNRRPVRRYRGSRA